MNEEEVTIKRSYLLKLENVAIAAANYENEQTEAWHKLEDAIRDLEKK